MSPRSTDPRYHQCQWPTPPCHRGKRYQIQHRANSTEKRRPDDHQDIGRTGFRKGETGSPPPTAKKKKKKTKIRVRAEATGRVLEREKLETPLDTDDYWLEFPLALPGHQTRLNSALRSLALRNWGEIVSFLGKSDSLSNWGYSVYFLCFMAQDIQGILLNAGYDGSFNVFIPISCDISIFSDVAPAREPAYYGDFPSRISLTPVRSSPRRDEVAGEMK